MSEAAGITVCERCHADFVDGALFCPMCGAPRAHRGGDPLIGEVLADRYLIRERLGHGGSGTIYLAEHVTLRRRVAVKILHHELSRDELAMERFRREATTVGEIDNEHIVEVYDFGRVPDGRLYLAMELLEGEALLDIIKREKQLSVARACDVLAQLGEALMEAHAMGYVHRDLRPRNVFIAKRRGKEGFVKLLDFGLAKLVEREGEAASTSLGMTFGDPRYMSPEQARGEPVDRRADLYSMGVIAYEMLVGEPPFVGKKVFDVLTAHLESDPIPPSTRRPDVPKWLESIVLRALAKEPENRFTTVYRLVEAIRDGQAHGAIMSDDVAASMPALMPPPPAPRSREGATVNLPVDKAGSLDLAAIRAEAGVTSPGLGAAGVGTAAGAGAGMAAAGAGAGASGASGSALANASKSGPMGISGEWYADGEALAAEGGAGTSSGGVGAAAAVKHRSFSATATVPRYRGEDAGLSASNWDAAAEEARGKRKTVLIAGGAAGVLLVAVLVFAFWPAGKKLEAGVPSGAATSAVPPGATSTPAVAPPNVPAPSPTPAPPTPPSTPANPTTNPPTPTNPNPATPTAVVHKDPVSPGPATPPPGPGPGPGPATLGGAFGHPAPEGDSTAPEPAPSDLPPPPGVPVAPELAQRAQFFVKLGDQALRQGDVPGAAGNYNKAREFDPRNPEAIAGLGQVAMQQGSWDDATVHLEEASRLAPKSARIHTLRGQAYLGAGKPKPAAAAFKRALKIDPDDVDARKGYEQAAKQGGE